MGGCRYFWELVALENLLSLILSLKIHNYTTRPMKNIQLIQRQGKIQLS